MDTTTIKHQPTMNFITIDAQLVVDSRELTPVGFLHENLL